MFIFGPDQKVLFAKRVGRQLKFYNNLYLIYEKSNCKTTKLS